MISAAPKDAWPKRVAIVPYGANRGYGSQSALLTGGNGHELAVEGPEGLMPWATRQRPRLEWACWDVRKWLPRDPARTTRGGTTALDGQSHGERLKCWESVWAGESFNGLMKALQKSRFDLIMLEAQICLLSIQWVLSRVSRSLMVQLMFSSQSLMALALQAGFAKAALQPGRPPGTDRGADAHGTAAEAGRRSRRYLPGLALWLASTGVSPGGILQAPAQTSALPANDSLSACSNFRSALTASG